MQSSKLTTSPSLKTSLNRTSNRSPFPPSLVFVYGTLKRDGPNSIFLDGSRFVCEGYTAYRYPLVVKGLPYLLPYRDRGQRVWGEVYEVDYPTLRNLDRLEGHPQWYARSEITIIRADRARVFEVSGGKLKAFAYFYQHATPAMMALPFLSSYKYGGRTAPLSEL